MLVFLPTLNDQEYLPKLIDEVLELCEEFVPFVIDDGSAPPLEKDGFPTDCLLFSLPVNLGLGVCTHIAFDHALAFGYEAAVRIDADGQHPIPMIREVLQPLMEGRADVVAGMRINRREKRRPGDNLRNLVKGYFSTVSRVVTKGGSPSDVITGFIATNRRAMHELNRGQFERYPEPQLFVEACALGLKVVDVEIEQLSRQHGNSTLVYAGAASMAYRFCIFAIAELLRFRR